jgi:hypothetical protein
LGQIQEPIGILTTISKSTDQLEFLQQLGKIQIVVRIPIGW